MLEYKYPRILHIVPVTDMYQEHSGEEGTEVYLRIAAFVVFEDIIDGKIGQRSRYLTHDQMDAIDDETGYIPELDDTWIANVHYEDITEAAKANSNLK